MELGLTINMKASSNGGKAKGLSLGTDNQRLKANLEVMFKCVCERFIVYTHLSHFQMEISSPSYSY